jgi:hypothetical protein
MAFSPVFEILRNLAAILKMKSTSDYFVTSEFLFKGPTFHPLHSHLPFGSGDRG